MQPFPAQTNTIRRYRNGKTAISRPLKDIDRPGHPLSQAIVDVILKSAIVSERAWQRAFKVGVTEAELITMRHTFVKQLREALQFFPIDYLEPADFPPIAKAMLIKYSVPKACIWPLEPPVKKIKRTKVPVPA